MAEPRASLDLYESSAESVLLFFTRRTFDPQAALDLTAETFAQAWAGWSRVRVDSAEEVHGWLFTIACRQLGRYLKRGVVERRAISKLGFSIPVVAEDRIAEIEHLADLEELRSVLALELQKLSGEQRQALQLRVVDELTYAEVARRLGTSEQAARARVSRGLRALSASLEPQVSHNRSRS